MLIFAEWNLPQRFFRAPPLFGGKKSKVLENRVGKIAFYKVQGHILGLFARCDNRFFFSIFFRKIRIFSRKKFQIFGKKNNQFQRGKRPKITRCPLPFRLRRSASVVPSAPLFEPGTPFWGANT